MLSAPTPRRERILIAGGPGSGKSSSWVSIAHWIAKTKAPGKVRVLDTDQAYEAMWSPEIDGVVECVQAGIDESDNWPGIIQGFKKASQPDDWIVIDMVDKIAEGAKGFFWRTVSHGDALSEIYLKAMTDENFSMGGAYGRNWDVINKIYADTMQPFLTARCHKLALTPAQEVFVDKKSGLALNSNDQDYVIFKYKPLGDKRLSHEFNTVLLSQRIPKTKGSEWTLTTLKERGPIGLNKRDELRGEKVSPTGGFVGSYLVKVGGWKL